MSGGWLRMGCVVGVLCWLATPCKPASEVRGEEPAAAPLSSELILCGNGEVSILDMTQHENGRPKKVWSWWASERSELPEHLKSQFWSTDDCKPIDGGSRILITSSGSGIALVERETGQAIFWASVPEAHSADILPRGRVAVAGSFAEGGNRLVIFDLNVPEKEQYSTELLGGHGVVWDGERQMLWALSTYDVRAYRLVDWESDHPSLRVMFCVDLPEGGGHDLYAVPGSPLLSVTTARHCWLFDRDTRSFRLHFDIPELGGVKSISVNPVTGQLAYIQAEPDSWCSEQVRLLRPDGTLRLPGKTLYKARWNVTTTGRQQYQ